MGFMTMAVMGQISSTLSPYSQFGLGVMSDQSQSFNRGMGGLGIGLRNGKQVNTLNPASYSAVDSLTMLFDMGVSGQVTNFKEGGTKVNGRTGQFDYAVASFRLLPKVGFSFGVVPYTNVGYSYYSTGKLNEGTQDVVAITESHTGSGGLSQAYVGAGWEFLPGWSVGVNLAYLWGSIDRSIAVAGSGSTSMNTRTRTYSSSFSSYKLDLGAQWQHRLDKDHLLTVGAIVGIGHQLGADAELINQTTTTAGTNADTMTVANAYAIPFTFGVGATLLRKDRLTIGLDYTLQKWGSLDYPYLNSRDEYRKTSGLLSDRHKLTAGLDWIPNPVSRKLYNRIHYKFGVYYATPYYKVQGYDGPKEMSVSAGFGVPIINSWNNRSMLNISAQWVRASSSQFITENTFRINIGLTFNERWFAKWKVD